jgi:hypothetical protein
MLEIRDDMEKGKVGKMSSNQGIFKLNLCLELELGVKEADDEKTCRNDPPFIAVRAVKGSTTA